MSTPPCASSRIKPGSNCSPEREAPPAPRTHCGDTSPCPTEAFGRGGLTIFRLGCGDPDGGWKTELVLDPPRTRYAKTADGVHIAYQVVGDGPRDLVFVPGLVNHLDFMWQDRHANRFFSRLAEFSRLILFDKRGTGLSDRDVGSATLEDRIEDVRTVMEAAGSEKAALLGYSEGGPMSILFAATHPNRITALILAESFAKSRASADYPGGGDPLIVEEMARLVDEDWGSGACLKYFAPALVDHPKAREAVGAWERMAGSPSAVLATLKMIGEIDLRPLLPSLQVPTLILQRRGDLLAPRAGGRYLADHIPNAALLGAGRRCSHLVARRCRRISL